MKRKTAALFMTGFLSLTAIAVTGAMVISNKGLLKSFLAKGEVDANSYTLTASNFSNGSGDISIGGETWHYNNASISGSTVTIQDVMYTTVRSGTSQADGRRGDGYTRMVFADLNLDSASGLVFHETDSTGAVKKGGNTMSADVDLTFDGTVAGADRRGIYFAQGADSSFSFTSLTMHYACTSVSPTVEITTSELSVSVGENGTIKASSSDVYNGDVVSYAWSSSDESVATVSGDSLTGTVSGVSAGNATITVTMTVNGVDHTDSLDISVIEAPSTVTSLAVLDTSAVQGAGIFCRFNPSSAGLTAAQIDGFGLTDYAIAFEDTSVTTVVNNVVLQEKGDSSYTCYVVCNSAAGLSDAFSFTADFKDSTNHIIYRAVWHFDGGNLATEIQLSAASFSVDAGSTLEVTASRASWLDGDATFAFASSDESVFTVSASDNVATISGVAEGSANLQVTMTIGEEQYTLNKSIAVTEAGVVHYISWYTEGTDNQRNHWDGAGVWVWVNYGDMGYDGFASFSAVKSSMTASYESSPSTTIRVEVISDDIAASTSCRVYLVAGAAYNSGTLTMTIPDAKGITCTGTITFVDGEATAYNS